ncbi:UbiB/Aminoglycoside phosphotransferase domain containing protein [Klebsormidium nitens]|uniref:UbiB/Aminoglycoside phosphotransferase domain containing protein n=1 Tax=Klebsormidium nitens TaxID=105231 RepID=A0A1Y1IGE6_KLENI|nr:UbiB/Aminoglycoside phosphotransferase domain containing protein [Klebsormidium nitens]|eukprot:GAQ87787.1 UbiB/Aminoglycoside phosphotransferase domain containing protein [Klebsormidium nitens]
MAQTALHCRTCAALTVSFSQQTSASSQSPHKTPGVLAPQSYGVLPSGIPLQHCQHLTAFHEARPRPRRCSARRPVRAAVADPPLSGGIQWGSPAVRDVQWGEPQRGTAATKTVELVPTRGTPSTYALYQPPAENMDTYSVSAEEAAAAARATNVPVYNPDAMAREYSRQPLKVLRRALQIVTTIGSFGLTLLQDRQRGRLDSRTMVLRAKQLRGQLTQLGPTFVKVGQALSTRPDLCPPEYLEELAALQDALPTFSDAEAFSLIERELGGPLESYFSSITATPIAAASLGQVYKARLRRDGSLVAVKVQRPGIVEQISLDFYLVRAACQLVDKYVDAVTTPLVPLVDEFAARVYQELNYVQEGRNAERFQRLYGDRVDVKVPAIYWEMTAARVLTMEWIQGTKLSDLPAIKAQGMDILALVNTGIQCSLRQLLEAGFFHADPHPGNLLATPDGKLAFLDFGMMSETPSKARLAIIGHVVHLVNRDYEAMARDYYVLDFLTPDVDVSPIVPALRGFFDDVLSLSVQELNFKTIVDGLGELYYDYPFTVPPYYALILRSLTVLEGLALSSDPAFKVLAAAYPYMAKRLLTDRDPYLRDALVELLFKDGRLRWNRLETLLAEGSKDSDYRAGEALQPVLGLLLGPGGEQLRRLVEQEAVRVTEALVIGQMLETARMLPTPLQGLVPFSPAGTRIGTLALGTGLKPEDEVRLLQLRAQVLRVWDLLRNDKGFDPASLQPILQVLQRPEAQVLSINVASGVFQRLAARFLQQLLRPAPATVRT